MADKILLKRNLTVGNAPTTSSLDTGELALNVADARVFIKQSGSGLVETVRSLVTLNVPNTGSINLLGSVTASLLGTASLATSASYAVTASYALNAAGGGGGGSTFPFTGDAVITGSLLVSGSGDVLRISGSANILNNLTINGGTLSVTAATNRTSISGSLAVTGSTDVLGNFTATTKSFKIIHQGLPNKNLVYGVLEGPEHAVYARGRLQNSNTICLPDEWAWLIDEETITVQFTPIGQHQKLYVKQIVNNTIIIDVDSLFNKTIDCYYIAIATRKDVQPLKTVE